MLKILFVIVHIKTFFNFLLLEEAFQYIATSFKLVIRSKTTVNYCYRCLRLKQEFPLLIAELPGHWGAAVVGGVKV